MPLNMSREKQSGVALVTALMFLVILTMLALSSMTNTTLEEKMAANSVEINRIFQAAESGVVIASAEGADYKTTHSEENPHVVEVAQRLGNAAVKYEVTYLQKTKPPRTTEREAMFDVNANAYHYNIRATATGVSGARIELESGIYNIRGN